MISARIKCVDGKVAELTATGRRFGFVTTHGQIRNLREFLAAFTPSQLVIFCYSKQSKNENYIPSGIIMTFSWLESNPRGAVEVVMRRGGAEILTYVLTKFEVSIICKAIDKKIDGVNQTYSTYAEYGATNVDLNKKFSLPIFPKVSEIFLGSSHEFPTLQ